MARDTLTEIFGTADKTTQALIASVEVQLRRLWKNPVSCQNALLVLHETAKIIKTVESDVDPRINASTGHQFPPRNYRFAIYAHRVPRQQYVNALALVIYATGCRVLGMPDKRSTAVKGLPADPRGAEKTLQAALTALDLIGPGEDRMQKAWAVAVDKLAEAKVRVIAVDTAEGTSIMRSLNAFVEDKFLPWIQRVKDGSLTKSTPEEYAIDDLEVAANSMKKLLFEAMLAKMGRAKAVNAFDTIVMGDDQMRHEDEVFLDEYLSRVHFRHDLASFFEDKLRDRVLHSGLSTTRILQIYMRIIITFRKLDQSGIVLRRLAEPIQSFLRTRDDAVHIILSSLLEDARDEHQQIKPSTEDFCREIASCMEDETVKDFREYHEGTDLTDENWMPEPIDAATGHQAMRNLDAIAHLVTISPRQAFINELQTVLASRLLHRNSPSFSHELRLLNLFKQRFEELHIQSCEIMVRDVLSSQALDQSIRTLLDKDFREDIIRPDLDFHALVLSKFYWPELASHEFTVPRIVRDKAAQYEQEFKREKKKRKLEFLNALGRATIHLQFEDREVEVECAPYQAAVINHFHNAQSRSIAELSQALEMEESLVQQACTYWVAQSVLSPVSTSPENDKTYVVLERLPTTAAGTPKQSRAAAEAAAQPIDATPPVKKPEDLLTDNKELYSEYVLEVLTNQSAMPATRIHAMMEVLPGGFPFTVDELHDSILKTLQDRGQIQMNTDGLWRVTGGNASMM